MYWHSRDGCWEVSVDFNQWMIGFNWHEGMNCNVFFLCFRLGRNADSQAAILRRYNEF